jgi:hypothetical protein
MHGTQKSRKGLQSLAAGVWFTALAVVCLLSFDARQGSMTVCHSCIGFPRIISIENEVTATDKRVIGRFAHSPFLIFHSPFFILHSPFFILHSPFFILHSSFSILHSPFLILHSPFFILHSSFFILHSPFFILHS